MTTPVILNAGIFCLKYIFCNKKVPDENLGPAQPQNIQTFN